MPDPALVSALTDVRKAYRLLWAYQKRIYDIVELIAGEFEDMGFYWWAVTHAGRPCQSGTNPMGGRWAWDMLPMVQISYLFLQNDTNRNVTLPGQWMLELHVVSDSGFEEAEDGSEPDPDDFDDAADSSSHIMLYAWYCTGETNRNWLNGVWKVTDWPTEDGGLHESADPPFKVFGKRVELTDMPDQDAVRAVAAAFRDDMSTAFGTTVA